MIARLLGSVIGRSAAAAVLVVLAVLSCSRPQPAPAPVPEPAPPAPAPRPAMAPATAAGTYALRAISQGRQVPAPPPARRGRTRAAPAPAGTLQLVPAAAAAPDPTAASATQFRAAVALPGYTLAPRGRTTQAASWWPTGGDGVQVYWVTPRGVAISLRGELRGDTLSGDVWYTSMESGSEFQLGRFTAVRRRAARR